MERGCFYYNLGSMHWFILQNISGSWGCAKNCNTYQNPWASRTDGQATEGYSVRYEGEAKISLAAASRWPQILTVLGAAATLVRLVFPCHDSHPSKGSCYLLSANWIKSMVKNLVQRKKQSLCWSPTFIRDERPNYEQIRMMVISWIYYIL